MFFLFHISDILFLDRVLFILPGGPGGEGRGDGLHHGLSGGGQVPARTFPPAHDRQGNTTVLMYYLNLCVHRTFLNIHIG